MNLKKILQTMNAIIVSVWHDFFVVVDFIKYTTFFCISDKARLWKKEFECDEEMHITLTRIITQFSMKGLLHHVLIFRTQNHLVFISVDVYAQSFPLTHFEKMNYCNQQEILHHITTWVVHFIWIQKDIRQLQLAKNIQ